MVKFKVEDIRRIMDEKDNIQNVCIISHVDHGKSTLACCLGATAGVIPDTLIGDRKITDVRVDEVERGFSIKSTGYSLCYNMADVSIEGFCGERSGNEYLINLIDTPGHYDFSAEVTTALRISDGAVLVIDCVDGVRAQTETVLRQALGESIRPVLVLNKFDRCFLEIADGEEAYKIFKLHIEEINNLMTTYSDTDLGHLQVSHEEGTVLFSSALFGWAFTIKTFAKMYASRFNVDVTKMIRRLWGDHFFDPSTKKWTSSNTGSSTCRRGFVQFCYEPIKQITSICMNNEKDKLFPMLQKLNVTLTSEESQLLGKHLMKRVMMRWLPAGPALMEMIVCHLPSPATSQRYRVNSLYEGSLSDCFANAIRFCDPEGPTMAYISKMIPAAEKGRFYAFGRVFSGKLCPGTKVRIMGPDYIAGEKKDLYFQNIQRTLIWMGKRQEPVADVPCGNTVVIVVVGLDSCILKSGTLTDGKHDLVTHPIRPMRFLVSPVARVALHCKNPRDLSKLVEGLRRLEMSDPLVECSVSEAGEHIVAGAGDLHLEVLINDLLCLMRNTEVRIGVPATSYRETVTGTSNRLVKCRSSNKKVRFSMKARPLPEILAQAIEAGEHDVQGICGALGDDLLARDLWCFGPERARPNVLLSKYKQSECSKELKDFVVSAFQLALGRGALADEIMRGVCVELCDIFLSCDALRVGTNLVQTAMRTVHSAQMRAEPRLLEPIYMVEFEARNAVLRKVCDLLYDRDAYSVETSQNSEFSVVKAFLPVAKSHGFFEQVRIITSGTTFVKVIFHHWDLVPSDPLVTGTRAADIVKDIRFRKGLKARSSIELLEESD